MEEPESSIRSLFASAKAQRKTLETFSDSTTSIYQENLRAAIASFEECRRLAERIALFSPNEAEDDISSGDLQYYPLLSQVNLVGVSDMQPRYLLTDYYLGELILKDSVSIRKAVLQRARETYERFLGLLDNYGMLSNSDKKLHERYLENRNDFSLMASSDPASRRDT